MQYTGMMLQMRNGKLLHYIVCGLFIADSDWAYQPSGPITKMPSAHIVPTDMRLGSVKHMYPGKIHPTTQTAYDHTSLLMSTSSRHDSNQSITMVVLLSISTLKQNDALQGATQIT